MPRTANLSADALAQCRATVDLTGTLDEPDIPGIRNAWAALKAARGQTVSAAHLTPAHLIEVETQEQPAPNESMVEAVERAKPAIFRAIRRLGLTPRSDLDGAA